MLQLDYYMSAHRYLFFRAHSFGADRSLDDTVSNSMALCVVLFLASFESGKRKRKILAQ